MCKSIEGNISKMKIIINYNYDNQQFNINIVKYYIAI